MRHFMRDYPQTLATVTVLAVAGITIALYYIASWTIYVSMGAFLIYMVGSSVRRDRRHRKDQT